MSNVIDSVLTMITIINSKYFFVSDWLISLVNSGGPASTVQIWRIFSIRRITKKILDDRHQVTAALVMLSQTPGKWLTLGLKR